MSLFKTITAAARAARRRRPSSVAAALPRFVMPSPPKSKPKRRVSTSQPKPKKAVSPPRPPAGSFLGDTYACPHGTLDYKLYTPTGSARRRMPLVVMLHGCSQSASDFAAGTDMNRIADEFGVLILYPQQSPKVNMGRCWNWHDPANQARGRGEPAVIAALTRHAMSLGRANPARVYVAGISAGGTAAAIVGAAYPDLFAAVGVHSGLPVGNIRSLRSAISAMRGKPGPQQTARLPRQLPTIVFHGDNDRVVHPSNAAGFLRNLERTRTSSILSKTRSGRSAGGRDFTRKIHTTEKGDTLLEEWTVHGGGHGWSGGSAAGSHTDPAGPDASREMIRFFLSRRLHA